MTRSGSAPPRRTWNDDGSAPAGAITTAGARLHLVVDQAGGFTSTPEPSGSGR